MDEQQNNSMAGSVPPITTQPPASQSPDAPKEKSVGPVVGIVIIIIIIVLGGLYFWGRSLSEQEDDGMTGDQISQEADPQAEALGTVSESDVLESIEADLNATELQNLDIEISNIDDELAP